MKKLPKPRTFIARAYLTNYCKRHIGIILLSVRTPTFTFPFASGGLNSLAKQNERRKTSTEGRMGVMDRIYCFGDLTIYL